MSHFNQYGNYYDPIGSQSSRPAGYSYSTSPSTAAYQNAASSSGYGASYGSNYQRQDGNVYNNQQYRADTTQQPTPSATHAAAALSSLSGQATSGNRTSSNNQYDNNTWYQANHNPNVYSANTVSAPNRTQSNNSPLYSSAQSSSTFGRLAVPEQTQSSSNTFGASQAYQNTNPSSATSSRSYQTAYTQQQQSQPQRYNSPLHAVQTQQHGHGKQSSRSSNHVPSPQMAQAPQSSQQTRQQSASAEPSPMTVDPSQVYDNRAELQRKAAIEGEKRRKYEAEQAAKKAEEERVAEQKRKEEEEKQKAEKEPAEKKAEQERKNAQRRKAREEKKQSKSAATTFQQMAQGMAEASAVGEDEEAQMRAMFQKMREFNAKNPALLAKLWDEERKSHEASKAQSPPQLAPAAGSSTAASASPTAAAQPKSAKTPAKPPQQRQPKPKSAGPNAPATKDQPATQPKPGKSAPIGTNASLWPPHKKSSLSDATAKWLTAMPENANAYIAPWTVLSILNDNPSYVELCRSLESLGVKFDRSQLARELLKAVPEGLEAQPAQPPTPLGSVSGTAPQVNGSSASSGSSKGRGRPRTDSSNQVAAAPVNYEAPISLTEAAREVNSMHQPVYRPSFSPPVQMQQQSPQAKQSKALTYGNRLPSQSQPPEVKQEMKPEEPPRPPADKEEAARKRTFGDLVDLTADDSDDAAPPSKKVMQVAPGSGPGATLGTVNGPVDPLQYLAKPISFNQFTHRPTGQTLHTSPYFTLPSNGAVPPPASVPGQYQTQPTPPPAPKQKGPTPEQLRQARMRGKMLVEPIMRDRVARKSNYDSRTIARDVLLATGRHPDMRGLNAHFSNMQKLLAAHGGEFDSGGNRSDLATIKWDIIDPVPSKEDKVESKSEDAEEQQQSRTPPVSNTVKYGSPPIPEDRLIKKLPVGKSGRPRGRPPRSRLPNDSSLTNGLGTSNSRSTTPARQASSRPTTPSSAPAPGMSSGAGVGYAAFNQTNPDGTKKKGRPFGWKKSVHSREAQGLPKITHPTGPVPSRLKQSSTPAKEVEPHYQEYKCNWAGCNHRLINLDTLKKHIVKVHGKPNERGEYFCLWKDCIGVKRPGLGAGRVPARFDNIEAWLEHLDENHLRPIAWKQGDGPKGGVAYDHSHFYSSPDTTPSYLSDPRGRSVTPIISPPMPPKPVLTQSGVEEGSKETPQPAVRKPGRPPKHGGVAKATSTSGGVEKDPELSKLAQHQRLVGPLMDKMGCVLASEERRTTFLDDEDFEDEGWGSEHDMRE